jgi:hypothetical protein
MEVEMTNKGFIGSILKEFICFNGLTLLLATIATLALSLMPSIVVGISIFDWFIELWSSAFEILTNVLYVDPTVILIVLLVMASMPPLFFRLVGECYVYVSGDDTNPHEISMRLCTIVGVLLGVMAGSGVFYFTLIAASTFN